MTEPQSALPDDTARRADHYKAASEFDLSFSGAGVSVLVAVFVVTVTGPLVGVGRYGLQDRWLVWWLPPAFVYSLWCFFYLYWLHTNTLRYFWPMNRIGLFVNDVGAFFAGCFWCVFILRPWYWGIAAGLLFSIGYYRTRHLDRRGPLRPDSKDTQEWLTFKTRFSKYRTLHSILIPAADILALTNFLLWLVLTGAGSSHSATYFGVALPVFAVLVFAFGTALCWIPRFSHPFYPLEGLRHDRATPPRLT